MHEIKIYPDLNKLTECFTGITEEKVEYIKKNGLRIRLNYSDEENPFTHREPYQMDLDYIDKQDFSAIYNALKFGEKFKLHKYIVDHTDELLFLTLIYNEQLWLTYNQYCDFYEGDVKAKEIAKFLLSYKTAKPDNPLQLVLRENVGTHSKPISKSASIKDSEIAEWMFDIIYKAVASAKFPLGVLGEQILSHLKINLNGTTKEIQLDDLERTANLSLSTPSVRRRNFMVELCYNILPFLREYTIFKNKPNVRLTNDQALFFYDLLSILGHKDVMITRLIDREYLHMIFRNYHRS